MCDYWRKLGGVQFIKQAKYLSRFPSFFFIPDPFFSPLFSANFSFHLFFCYLFLFKKKTKVPYVKNKRSL